MTVYTIKTEEITTNPYMLDVNKERFLSDWEMRNFIKERACAVPDSMNYEVVDKCFDNPFWNAYAEMHNVLLGFNDSERRLKDYQIAKPLLICSSGGVESAFTEMSMPNADILHIDESTSFVPHSMEGSLPFIGASMGYAVTLIGMEAFTVSKSSIVKKEEDDNSLKNIDLRDSFKELCNKYTYPCQHHSIVSLWDRDELVVKAFQLGIKPKSCLKQKEGYCGDCYKCWSIYVCLKYHGITPPFKMPYNIAKKYFREVEDYYITGEDPFYSVGTFVKMKDAGFDVTARNIYD